MTYPYTRAGITTRLRQLALTALLAGSATAAQAQALPYVAANVTKVAGTYTDLGTTGTAIAVANNDDANSAPQAIGFAFNYNGTAFTNFVLNTNGFIKLGSTAPTGPMFPNGGQATTGGPVDSPETNLILPFNQDLAAGSAGGTEYRVSTTGTAPNRICTIQWKNVRDKAQGAVTGGSAAIGTQYANFSFQVKLYETSSQISFVYGTATPGAAADENPKFVTVGIKGSGTAANQLILGSKASASPWSATVFAGGLYTANAHNVRSSVLPPPGYTYNFTLPVAQDAAVEAVYGFDKLTVPAGQPVVIRAAVRNAGTSALGNFTVTLNVSGANTATASAAVASLAIGATTTVVFPAVAMPAVGNNTVTVTAALTGDGNATNDSQTMLMATNATTTGFITAGQGPVSAFGFGAGAQGNYFGAKVTYTQPRDITAVNAFLFNDPAAVGSTAYGVVIDATTGALLGRSPDFVVTAASLNQLRTFTLSSPVSVQAGDVIVGMATVAAAGATQFFLMGVQAENPTRPGTFFTGSATAMPPTAPGPSLNTPTSALYKYMLEAVSTSPASCAAPTGLSTSGTQTTAVVSFTGPSNGSSYVIVYGPQGFNPATGGTTTTSFTTSPFTVTGLTSSTCYDFYVRATCVAPDQSQLAGPVRFCTPCTPPIITSFPYSMDFNTIGMGQALPCGISVSDVNNDNNTWQARATVPTQANPNLPIGRGGTGNAMVYFYNTNDNTVGGDDWFYTPALRLTGGQRYRLSFWLRSAGASYPEGLEVKYGSSATPAGQTNMLYTNTSVTSATYVQATNTSTPAVADIMPATTGTYYVGFHAISAADQFFLAVDDVTISAVLGTSAALNRAISVYPNPSTSGKFSLEVRGANAKSLGVEVTNMMGQRVYTGSAKDNFTNEVDLSNLAAGIYTIKVLNGQDYSLQQISIVK
ncbi:hypothetical protein GCM10023185_26720 [Hymenobacter saemangeumensis]|uniref:Fibronectin type-III domain-containing protein n=1 Tax=Hymenobacter saemangeumensis TaxID=1084522 RepID=A0ABP8IJ36_9BACT